MQLPDGSTATREYVVHPGAVMVVPLLDDGRIVVERQYRYPMHRAMIELPAGKLDAGERTFDCARRELFEETGYRAREWAQAGVLHPVISYSTEFIEIWFARGLTAGERQLDTGEFLEVFTMSPAELLEGCRSGAHHRRQDACRHAVAAKRGIRRMAARLENRRSARSRPTVPIMKRMKVLDLGCDGRHAFEGWFGSEDDFQSQLARGLVECPMCGSSDVHKLLSAPRLNLGAARPPQHTSRPDTEPAVPSNNAPVPASALHAAMQPAEAAMQAAWLKTMRHVVANTEDVGTAVRRTGAPHALRRRRITRNIRGQASRDEAEALLEEGIDVMPLRLPPMLDSTEH